VPQSLGRSPGHRDPDRLATTELLCARSRVDHDPLPHPGLADHDRNALLGAQELHCPALLGAQLADSLRHLRERLLARALVDLCTARAG